jgi:hypothetical protein
MPSIFEQLGYNFTPSGNDIVNFTDDVLDSLNRIPPLLNEWQYNDLRNDDSDVTNYVTNPVASISNSIKSTSQQIMISCLGTDGNVVPALSTIYTTANNVVNSATQFVMHTDRLTGLVEPNEDTAELPHYDIAIGIGKSVMYLVYQSDGVQNNAPIMGSFTSLCMKEELQTEQSIIISYPNLISSSISCTSAGEPPETTCTSNLSSGQISTIVSKLSSINTLFNTRRTHDENYYTNATNLLRKYEEMKRYKDVGQSEKNLFINYTGTERLKSNLT